MAPEESKQLLLEDTKNTILLNAKTEFSKLIGKLDGNEELMETSDYLFNKGLEDLFSDNSKARKDVVWVLNHSFSDLASTFKQFIGYQFIGENEKFGDNLKEQLLQMIRFINFVKYMQNTDNESLPWKELKSYFGEIRDFIFNNSSDWRPRDELWSEEFKNMERTARIRKSGFETYYMSTIIEVIRTFSNKRRHKNAFPKTFETEFNFYDDFHQLIGIYNISIYSFIEMIEAWVSIKPFFENYPEVLTE